MNILLLVDVGSVILVIITLILWIAILIERFIHPAYKNYFRGSRLWPLDETERKRIKKWMQSTGVYFFITALLLIFSPPLALLLGFVGIFYSFISYYWLVVLKKDR